MSHVQEQAGQLTVVRCWCGVQHAVPASLRAEQERHRDEGLAPLTLWCPLGHQYVIGGASRVVELERKLSRTEAALEGARVDLKRKGAELEKTERRRRAQKAAATRVRRRLVAGVCPCCQTEFPDVGEHLRSAHPEFRRGGEEAEGAGGPA